MSCTNGNCLHEKMLSSPKEKANLPLLELPEFLKVNTAKPNAGKSVEVMV